MNNNSLQETYKIAVEILTPVNIAANTKLNAKEYLYDAKNETVYFLNQTAWHKFIYTHNLLDEYEKYMTGNDKKSLYEWLQSCGYTTDDIKSAIKAKAYAHVNVMKQKKTLNDIVVQSKLADGTPYIPGSSIKGAIRTAILYNLIRQNKFIQEKYWRKVKSDFMAAKAKRFYVYKINNIIGSIAAQLETDLLHRLKLYNAKGEIIKPSNAVCSTMRGIIVSDSEHIKQNVSLEILQKIDFSLINGIVKPHGLPIFRECILSNAKFDFQLKLDKTITEKIGINSVDDLLDILQNYFDFVNNILKNAFGRECADLFNEIKGGNIYLGANTGFLTKTLVMALAPTKKEAVDFIRDLLDINFNGKKNSHNGQKDKLISPRTLKATAYNGRNILMGVGRIYKNE